MDPSTASAATRTRGARRQGQHRQGQQNTEDSEIPRGSIPYPNTLEPFHTILASPPLTGLLAPWINYTQDILPVARSTCAVPR